MSDDTKLTRRNTKWIAPAKGGYSARTSGESRNERELTPPKNKASATVARPSR